MPAAVVDCPFAGGRLIASRRKAARQMPLQSMDEVAGRLVACSDPNHERCQCQCVCLSFNVHVECVFRGINRVGGQHIKCQHDRVLDTPPLSCSRGEMVPIKTVKNGRFRRV